MIDIQIYFQNELLDELVAISNKNLSVCYYRTTNNTNSYIDDKILSLSEFSTILDSLYNKYSNKLTIACGVNIYNQIRNILECHYTVYPRLSFCERGYIYLLNCDGNVYTCEEAVFDERFKLCNINQFIQYPLLYKRPKQKSFLIDNTSSSCKCCEVNTICGGGCKFAKENHKNFCEKKEILKTISEMYLRRKNSK